MKNIIIGTAGHIDHGKTTLIKALTGRNTDRWEEGQRGGITIDLGFTYFDVPVEIVQESSMFRDMRNLLTTWLPGCSRNGSCAACHCSGRRNHAADKRAYGYSEFIGN